jgi:hypothetical protein
MGRRRSPEVVAAVPEVLSGEAAGLAGDSPAPADGIAGVVAEGVAATGDALAAAVDPEGLAEGEAVAPPAATVKVKVPRSTPLSSGVTVVQRTVYVPGARAGRLTRIVRRVASDGSTPPRATWRPAASRTRMELRPGSMASL